MSEKVMKGLVQVVQPRGGKVFVVGDLHGGYELFREKLVLVNFDFEHDLVICVGDLVDRGRANLQCVSLLDEDWFVSVKGNHEDFCVMGHFDQEVARIHSDPRNGGAWFYALNETERDSIARKFHELPLAMEVDYGGNLYGFTHADMPFEYWEALYHIPNPSVEIAHRTVQDWLIWSRGGYDQRDTEAQNVLGVAAVFHGHTPTRGVVEKRGNQIYVDFGACFGYDLCVMELGEAVKASGMDMGA